MPLAKSDIPNLLLAGIRTVFGDAYITAQNNSTWQRIATVIPSTKDTEPYAWLGSTPAMREFVGERIAKGLSEFDYSLKNKTWEATIGVRKDAIEDEQYGQIRLRIQQLAEEAARHKDELVFELLAAGFTGDCYDGQDFFDANHTVYSSDGTDSGSDQSNLGTSALDASTLQAGITAMEKFTDDHGKPMGIIPDTLVVPPDLKWTAMELLKSAYNVDGTANNAMKTNVLQGALDLVVSPYLTDDNNWYLLCTKRIVKPLIFQDRVSPELESLEGASETGFMRDEYLYGVRARYNAGYGLWQLAYGANVT